MEGFLCSLSMCFKCVGVMPTISASCSWDRFCEIRALRMAFPRVPFSSVILSAPYKLDYSLLFLLKISEKRFIMELKENHKIFWQLIYESRRKGMMSLNGFYFRFLKKNRQLFFFIFCLVFSVVCLTSCGKKENIEENSVGIISSEEEAIPKYKEIQDERIEQAVKNKSPALIVSNEEAKPNEHVIVAIYLANNPGVLGMSGTLSYDENVVTLEKVENGEAFKSIMELNTSKELGSGCRFLLSGEDVSPSQVEDGIILNLEFSINKNASQMKTPITLVLDQDGTYDKDLSLLDLSVENGYISIIHNK